MKIGRRAQRQVERISNRWQASADYPLLFEEELEDALRMLAQTPNVGVPYPTEKRAHLKRILLREN
jgi:hypothetical protein